MKKNNNILLVSHDKIIRAFMKLLLVNSKIFKAVHSAFSIDESIEQMKKNDYSIVLFERFLLELLVITKGIDYIRNTTTGYAPTIIVCSAYQDIHLRYKTEFGADDFLLKPFSGEELLQKVKGYIVMDEENETVNYYLNPLDLSWRNDYAGCDYDKRCIYIKKINWDNKLVFREKIILCLDNLANSGESPITVLFCCNINQPKFLEPLFVKLAEINILKCPVKLTWEFDGDMSMLENILKIIKLKNWIFDIEIKHKEFLLPSNDSKSPGIRLDFKNFFFEISGIYVDHFLSYLKYVIERLKVFQILHKPGPDIIFKFYLTYFDESIDNHLSQIFTIIKELASEQQKIIIEWIFQEENKESVDYGEKYRVLLIAYEEHILFRQINAKEQKFVCTHKPVEVQEKSSVKEKEFDASRYYEKWSRHVTFIVRSSMLVIENMHNYKRDELRIDVVNWLSQYESKFGEIFRCYIYTQNTHCTFIYILFKKFEKIQQKGITKVKVYWFYDDDEDLEDIKDMHDFDDWSFNIHFIENDNF